MKKLTEYPATMALAAFLILLVILAAVVIDDMNDCHDHGGDYVRGFIAYTCVGEDQ